MSYTEQFIFDDNDACCVLCQNTQLDLYCANTLKQKSYGRGVIPPGPIILILSLLLLLKFLSGEVSNTNVIVLGLIFDASPLTITPKMRLTLALCEITFNIGFDVNLLIHQINYSSVSESVVDDKTMSDSNTSLF